MCIRDSVLVAQAEDDLQAQRLGPALRALESAVVLTPDDAWLRHRLARVYLRLGRRQEALHAMDEGVARIPSGTVSAEMLYARALIRSALDDDTAALADMQRIPSTDQTEAMRALVRRSQVKSLVTQALKPLPAAEVEALLQQAERTAGNEADLLYNVANAWFRRAQPARGVAVFHRLAARVPTLAPDTQLDYAQLLNRAEDDAGLAEQLPRLLQAKGWSAEQELSLIHI